MFSEILGRSEKCKQTFFFMQFCRNENELQE